MQKQNFIQGGFMPKNRQHNRKTKYPDKVTKPKRLVFVRIFLFSSVGIKIQYFPTTPLFYYRIGAIISVVIFEEMIEHYNADLYQNFQIPILNYLH